VAFRIGVATLTKVDVFQWMIFSISVAIATDKNNFQIKSDSVSYILGYYFTV
jgi:hypothetical protein